MSIIVLEGPDLAGKTETVRWLKAQSRFADAIVLKQGPPRGDILERYLKPIEDLLTGDVYGPPRTLILDRWHIGELIYGPLLRGKSQLTEQQADYIDMVLQTFSCMFNFVIAPTNVLEDRYDIRGDGLIKREQLHDIVQGYMNHLLPRTHWAFVSPSMGSGRGVDVPEQLPHAPMAGRYIGPARPCVLLLGDERNDQRFVFPFVPTRASSGHWLMGALRASGVNHMHVGIMNASEVDPGILFAQWWELGKPPVVCLGNNAWRQWTIAHEGDWKDVGIKVNHPQWMRRFAYTAMESYGRTIKEAMDG